MEIKQENLGYHMFSFWVVDENDEQYGVKMSLENAIQFCEERRKTGGNYRVVCQKF